MVALGGVAVSDEQGAPVIRLTPEAGRPPLQGLLEIKDLHRPRTLRWVQKNLPTGGVCPYFRVTPVCRRENLLWPGLFWLTILVRPGSFPFQS